MLFRSNNAEHQLAFIEMLRLITDGKLSPEEAVRAYHGVLQARGIKPHRQLDDDLKLTDQAMSYDGSATKRSTVEMRNNPLAAGRRADSQSTIADSQGADWPKLADGTPDFERMSPQHRRAFDVARLNRRFG